MSENIKEMSEMLQNVMIALETIVRREAVKMDVEDQKPKNAIQGNSPSLPELDKWDRRRAHEWIKSTKMWVEIAKLTYTTNTIEQIYARLRWACVSDSEALLIINATKPSGLEATFNTLQKAFGDDVEDEMILDKIFKFRIKPHSKLVTNWFYYNALVERATQLGQNPGEETVARIFMTQLSNSHFKGLVDQIKFKYPERVTIPWSVIVMEMERLHPTWDRQSIEWSERKTGWKEQKDESRGREKVRPTGKHLARERSPCWGCNKYHRKGECPAQDKTCQNCARRGHFTELCRSKRSGAIKESAALELKQEFLVDTGSELNLFGKQLAPFVKVGKTIQKIKSPIGGIKTVKEATIQMEGRDGERITIEGYFDVTSTANIINPCGITIGDVGPSQAIINGEILDISMKGKRPYINLKVVTSEDVKMDWIETFRILGFTLDPKRDRGEQWVIVLEMLHRRLLHPNSKAMLGTLKLAGINADRSTIKMISESCKLCVEKNATDKFQAYSQNSNAEIEVAHNDFGLNLTADIGFAEVTSEHGHIGVSIVKCKGTNFLWVRAIMKKSEAQHHVIDVINSLDDVKTIHTDGGKEYQGTLERVMCKRGITHLVSPTRSNESSGSIEIAVKRIKILIATALKEFRLSNRKWHWLVRAASMVHNLTADHTGLSPDFKRRGKTPKLDLLPTSEFVLTSEDSTSMNNLRGETQMFIGFHSNGCQFDFIKITEVDIDWKSEHARFASVLRPIPTSNMLEKDYHSSMDIPLAGADEVEQEEYADSEEEEEVSEPPKDSAEVASLSYHRMKTDEQGEFTKAMEKELQSFYDQKVFTKPFDAQTLPAFWILTYKKTGPKARLTVLGNHQKDNTQTFTELPSLNLLRMLLYRITQHQMPVTILDITSAFLHAELDQPINIRLPDVMPQSSPFAPKQVVGIKKAVYGLRQSPRLFVNKVRDELLKKNWKHIVSGFFKKESTYIFIYVDDAIIIGDDKEALKDFAEAFSIGKIEKLSGESRILGMNLEVQKDRTVLSLQEWCETKLRDVDVRGLLTSTCIQCDLSKPSDPNLVPEGRMLLGEIGWAARLSPRLSYFQSHMAGMHAAHPCRKSIAALKKLVKHIKHLPPKQIFLPSPPIVNIFTDASYQRTEGTARMGYLITICETEQHMNTNVIAFGSRKVKKKILSTYAAEMEAVVYGLRNHAIIRKELQEIVRSHQVRLWTDSLTVCRSLQGGRCDEGFSTVNLEVARQYMEENSISCHWTPRKWQHADVLTHFTPLE